MVSARGRTFGFGSATLVACCGTVAMLVRALGSPTGDIDPLGAAVATSSFVVSVWGAFMTLRSTLWQETDLAEAAERLASQVLAVEREARRQLLGGHDRTVDVRFVFRPSPAHSALGADGGGTLADVAGYFHRLRPRRMVVTGVPGAGKTVLAVQLMLRLLEQRGPDEPVPVRISLASLEPHLDVEAWVARHLVRVYHLPRQAADVLVTARRVLPVLDGLDELDTVSCPGYGSRSAQVLRALNGYQQGVHKGELILTCRTDTHDALEEARVWAHDAARIEIQPVTATEARRFLNSRVDDLSRWAEVLDSLDRNPTGPLAVGLATLWRLTLAATVYEQRHPSTGAYARAPRHLLAPHLDSADAVGTHLLDLFIPATAELFPRSRGSHFDPGQVCDWLTTLADYLQHNATTGRAIAGHRLSGTDIVLANLWPLADTRHPRTTLVLPAVALSLTGAAGLLALLSTQGPLLAPWPFLTALVITSLFAAWVWSETWSGLEDDNHRNHQVRTAPRTFIQRFREGLGYAVVLPGVLIAAVVSGSTSLSAAEIAMTVVACVGALGLLFSVPLPAAPESSHPALNIRSHLVWSLLAPAMIFSELMLAAALAGDKGVAATLVLTVAGGLAGGFLFSPMLAPTGLWYVGLLLRTRRWTRRPLPWRLGRFLTWCYDAGLVRVAGTAYQFRHRELQDHLARSASSRG
ncbi:NACHT domain-containing protein [Streptomyces longisporoflavus]|uniref:NACHT domain-containing protein n=1 Tax=Streptomyces longisporoflavus TaxID=28044 RepID=A0ABW7R5E2_9ACTN